MTPVEAHATYAVSNAVVRLWPFSHAVVEDVLPAEFYAALLDALPPLKAYTTLAKLGRVGNGAYEARKVIVPSMVQEGPIAELFGLARSVDFCRALLRPFEIEIKGAISPDSLLVSDLDGYKIGPHTDAPHRIVSLLLYLPRNSRESVGTSLYVPKDRAFTHDGTRHLRFEEFDRVATVPFRPNTALLFARTDRSFHGVEPIALLPGARRDMFLLNLRHPRP